MAEDRVLRAARALDDDTLSALVASLDDDARRTMAGSLRLSAGAFAKAKSPVDLLVRSLRRLPPPTRADVGSMLTVACLDDAVERLGDDAEEPTKDQLLAVLPAVVETHGLGVTRLMLAATAGSEAPARETCAEVFDNEEQFSVDHLPQIEPSVVTTKATAADPAELQRRDAERERRRADKQARKEMKQRDKRAQREADEAMRRRIRAAKKLERVEVHRSRDDSVEDEPLEPITVPEHLLGVSAFAGDSMPEAPTTAGAAARDPRDDEMVERAITSDGLVTLNARIEERPPLKLTGSYDHLLEDDPLIGVVVVAALPRPGGGGIKKQPAVVIAATPHQLIVRPCMSEHERKPDDDTALPMSDWAGAGFKEPAYISPSEAVVARRGVHDELGYLSGRDWTMMA